MEEVLKATTGYQLIVRKRISSIVEKLLRCCGNDFRHDIYKQIVYGEIPYNTPFEEKIKNYYDAFQYLLSNRMNPLTKELLEKFFFLFNPKNIDQYVALRITSLLFYLNGNDLVDKLLAFHVGIYQELEGIDEDERFIISWMFLNYYLVRNGIPCIQLLRIDYKDYISARNEYLVGNKQQLKSIIIKIIQKTKFQTIEFEESLRIISTDEIIAEIKKDEEMLQKKYKIKKLFLFGSFAKGLSRIDSDIDLMALFSKEASYEEKIQHIKEINMYYENKFHRYIDVSEISTYLTDDFLKEHVRIIEIY